MNPLTALALNDTLGTKNHAVVVRLGEALENRSDLLDGKLLGSLHTNRCEYLVCVVVMVMIVTTALAVLIVVVVMMLVMIVTTALAVLIVIVVVMVMIVTTALAVLIVIMVMMLVMLMTTALAVLIVIMVMMVMMVVMLMLLFKSLYRILKGVLVLHSRENIHAGERLPRSCNDNRTFIMLTKEANALADLLIPC